MSLTRVALALANLSAHHATLMQPAPKVEEHEMTKYDVRPLNPTGVSLAVGYVNGTFWAGTLAELALILISVFPAHPVSQRILSLLPRPAGISNIGISRGYLVASAFLISSGIIRVQAYRAMGRFFTYPLTIRDNHKLVTWGPYSVVRHPGYTGSLFALIGAVVAVVSPGSWVRECGVLDSDVGKGVIYGGLVLSAAVYARVLSRLGVEDETLRKEFGKKWDEWAERVPYKLIPWIY